MTFLKNFVRDESGASAAEYALLLVVIGLVIVVAAGTLADSIGGAMTRTATTIDGTGGTTSGSPTPTPTTAP